MNLPAHAARTALPAQRDALQGQLFVYAQDLHDLMTQHALLQRRYQMVLQSHGRSDQSADMLVNALCHMTEHYLVTDLAGRILAASAAAQDCLAPGQELQGRSMGEFSPMSQRDRLQTLLASFDSSQASGAVRQCRLMLTPDKPGADPLAWSVLLMPVRKPDRLELYWLLSPAATWVSSAPEVQKSLLTAADCAEGLLLTDATGVILAVNPAFSRITGYNAADALGQTSRLLSSGRHDADFYRAFWAHLIDAGSWTGEFFNRKKNGHLYSEWKTIKAITDEQGTTTAYLAAFSDISNRDSEARQLSQLAYHDSLTGLANRRRLEMRLSQALETATQDGSTLCLMYLDLDKFKPVNDEFGHAAGDKVLQEVSARLQSSVRRSDTVARMGGDEFVILLQSPVSDADAYSIAYSILSALHAPIALGEHEVTIGVSIGCARYPQDGSDMATLLHNADAAMYGAKSFGIEFCFFDNGAIDRPATDLGFDLWRALDREEMFLLYQPQVTPDKSHQLRGCEVLLRWQHATLGEISPLTFIPIAEKNGAMLALGYWVLQTACTQLAQWQRCGLRELTLSINVSWRQLADPQFGARVSQILLDSGIEARALELEISEPDAMLHLQDEQSALSRLRAQGVKLAIDDFGVGYSNLARLRSLPIDRLKISQSVVRDLAQSSDARAISDCFVGIGNAMGMEVTASGVESGAQMDVLAKQGCGLVQGYFTGKPMRADALLAWALQAQAA
jgi:diguanylate cyclase (GGDEF)-like protein/PAS domain S-box-containing protein